MPPTIKEKTISYINEKKIETAGNNCVLTVLMDFAWYVEYLYHYLSMTVAPIVHNTYMLGADLFLLVLY